MNDLISIIIPVYNVEKYLRKCLDSIINQTYKNIEIIIINDGSVDNSKKIIQEYMQKDKRIVFIDRGNKGILPTRVEGYKIARGEYITFVDSDDWVEENIIEVMYKKLIEKNAEVVRCDFVYNNTIKRLNLADVEKDTYIENIHFEPDFYNRLLGKMVLNNVWGQLFKRTLLEKDVDYIDTSIGLGDDLEFNLKIFKNIKSILFISEPMYHYRINPKSITRIHTEESIKKNMISVVKAYYNAYKFIDNINVDDKEKYRSAVLSKLINEVINWSVEFIGVGKEKKDILTFLNKYYNKGIMEVIINEIKVCRF